MASTSASPIKNWALTVSSNWIEVGSSVIGYELYQNDSEWRYRIKQYSFTTPSKINDVAINRISKLKLTFPTNVSPALYGWEEGWGGEKLSVYCFVSTSSQMTIEELTNNIKNSTPIEFTSNQNGHGVPKAKEIVQELKPNTKYYLYIHSNSSNAFCARYWPISEEIAIETTDITYTECIAPTTFRFSEFANSTIVKPEQQVTIEWSGANGGTSNPISKYEIYYKYDDVPSVGDGTVIKTISISDISGSVSITIPSGNRGKTLYFGIVTVGQINGYNSTIKTGPYLKINQLPIISEVQLSTDKVPSAGGQVKVNSITGSDSDNQSISYCYSSSPSGSKIDININESILIKSNTTLYFWAKDTSGEYSSSYITKTIGINTRPTNLNIAITPTIITANGKNSIDGYAYCNKIEAKVTNDEGRTLTAWAELRYNDKVVTYTSSNTNLSITDVETKVKDMYNSNDLKYSLTFYAKDDIESFNLGTYNYAIPGAPVIKKITDGDSVFYKRIIFTHPEDTSVKSYSFTTESTEKNIIKSQTYAFSNGEVIHTIDIAPDCPGDTEIIFTLKADTKVLIKKSQITLKSGYIPNTLDNAFWSGLIFKPFEKTEQEGIFNIGNPFTGGIDKYKESTIDLQLESKLQLRNKTIPLGNVSKLTESNDISFTVKKSDIFGLQDFENDTYGLESQNGWCGTHSLTAKFIITIESTIQFVINVASPVVLDFNSKPKSCEITTLKYENIEIYDSKNKIYNFSLQEGMTINFKINLQAYTKQTYTVDLEYSFNNKAFSRASQIIFDDKSEEGAYGNGETPGEMNKTVSITIPKVANTIIYWRARVIDLSMNIESNTYSYPSIVHDYIQGFKIDLASKTPDNTGLKLDYSCTNIGYTIPENYSPTITHNANLILNGKISEDVEVVFSNNKGSRAFTCDVSNPPYQAQLKITQTIKQTIDSSITYSHSIITTTPIFNVYFDVPTVSYRHNCLGINTQDPNSEFSDSILVISPTQSKNSITLNVLPNTKFYIKATNEVTLDNFIIDGGTW